MTLSAATPGLAVVPKTMEERVDGWFSALSGYGTTRDKRYSVDFAADMMTDREVQQLWRGNAIAKRVIEASPKQALRQGFQLKAGDKELSEKVLTRFEELKGLAKFAKVMCYRRAYGGGAIFPVLNDSVGSLAKPINLKGITEIRHLQTFEARELQPAKWYASPLDEKFGEPETYMLNPIARGGMIASMFGTEIHESRLIIFNGFETSRSQYSMNTGWGDSVLTAPRETLRDYGVSWAATAVLLHEFAQASMKIKGLADALAGDNDDIIKARISAVMLSRSTINTVLMDSEEEFERKQTPVSGLAELLREFATKLASDCDMPVTLLMGISPGGLNATGESDIRFYYDRIAAERELDTKPQLEQLIRLILLERGGPAGGKEPESWSVEFNPLWQQTEAEIATTRKTVAETDQINITNGVYTAQQAKKSHYGGDTYSIDVVIDPNDLEAEELSAEDMANVAEQELDEDGNPVAPKLGPDGKPLPVAPAPVIGPDGKPIPQKPGDVIAAAAGGTANVQSTAMNGAQVTSLIDVVKKAADGEIHRDSAKAILIACFPVTPEEAEKMLGPVGFKPKKEEPPPGFGGPPGAPIPPGQKGASPFAKKPVPVDEIAAAPAVRKDGGPGSGPRKGGGASKDLTGSGPHGFDTKEKFFDAETKTWAAERVALHDEYTRDVTRGRPTSATPTVYMTGGGQASGKTSGLLNNDATGIPKKARAAYCDPDAAKEGLPEYRSGVKSGDKMAATNVHEESAHMSQSAMKQALAAGHDVVYDSSGDGGIAKLSAKVAAIRKQGAARIEANYATIDLDVAIQRSDARGAKSGRFVPHELLRQVHGDVAKTSMDAVEAGLYDTFKLFDTSGTGSKLVATWDKASGMKVHDRDAFDKHLVRAGRKPGSM